MSKNKPEQRSRYAQYRDRLRGGPPRQPQPCGTVGGARRHHRAGEQVCEPCRKAWNAYQAEQYARRQATTRGSHK